MPLSLLALPNATPYDAAEDPPGSIDALGTLPLWERLADVLLPGFTARMYRADHRRGSCVTSPPRDSTNNSVPNV